LVALGLATISAGCQVNKTVPSADRLSTEPIFVDGAMAQRNWPTTSAKYETFTTIAGPTGFVWTTPYNPETGVYTGPGGPKHEAVVNDLTFAPLFVANLIAMPVALIVTPPWAKVESSGGTVPPTYTAAYPLTPVP